MTLRITAGITFILLGLSFLGIASIPNVLIGLFALIAGIVWLVGM